MKLTQEQEETIEKIIDSQGFKIKSLRDDIIDHLCCVVENGMGKEKTFHQLLDKAISDLAPNGLIDIENKTIFLLNSKRILLMKKLLYFTGFIGSLTLTAGVTFKLLQMPFGYQLFITGFLILFLIFIPLLAIDRYKVAISKALTEKMKIILGTVAAIFTGLSGLFKLMHLQGAELLLLAGAFIFCFGFLPFFFFTMYKRSIS